MISRKSLHECREIHLQQDNLIESYTKEILYYESTYRNDHLLISQRGVAPRSLRSAGQTDETYSPL
jgi:hypothetical protein